VETLFPATGILWEKRLASESQDWSPPVPVGCDITIEGDEVYTKVEKTTLLVKSWLDAKSDEA
jgi:hypothetical protein